jgi:hypothetical protein
VDVAAGTGIPRKEALAWRRGNSERLRSATSRRLAPRPRSGGRSRNLPKSVRQDLGRQGAKARARHGTAGRNLEDRSRQQLYDEAKRLNIRGRSRMGKWELIDAIRGQR